MPTACLLSLMQPWRGEVARPVPGRRARAGRRAMEIASALAGSEPLRAGTARAPGAVSRYARGYFAAFTAPTCCASLWTDAAMRSSMLPAQRKAGRPYSKRNVPPS